MLVLTKLAWSSHENILGWLGRFAKIPSASLKQEGETLKR